MIPNADPLTEPLLPLPAVVKLIDRMGGQRPHVSTIIRWCLRGCKGIRLESVCIGRTRYVRRSALEQFIGRLTDGETQTTTVTPSQPAAQATHHGCSSNPRQQAFRERRAQEIAAAKRRLDERGASRRAQKGDTPHARGEI